MTATTPNLFLSGEFTPVRAELTEFDLPVTGTLPEQLTGRYLRNGPNPVSDLDPDTYNWFTGDGMVHGIALDGGRARWYRNRWVDSPVTAAALHSRGVARSAPSDAGRSFVHGPGANTNVIGFAGRTLALVEAGLACQELSSELDTIDVCDFDGTVRNGFTAHPLEDPETGELHAISYHFGLGDSVRYTVIGRDGHARREVDITVGGSPMMHSFSLTASSVIVYDLPVVFDPRQAAELTTARPLRPMARLALGAIAGRVRLPHAAGRRIPSNNAGRLPYRWDPAYRARVGILPREGEDDDVRWIDVDPCYVYHSLNAYDDGGDVVVDLVVHERTFDRDLTGPTEGRPRLERWRLNPVAGTCTRTPLDDTEVEFPRCDERYTGSAHTTGWMVATGDGREQRLFSDRLVRVGVDGYAAAVRSFGEGSSVGEFVFVPRSSDATEGDGFVMGLVSDLAEDTTSLTVLDAQTLEDVAAVALPQRVPPGFHGNWLPD